MRRSKLRNSFQKEKDKKQNKQVNGNRNSVSETRKEKVLSFQKSI